jgi:hypothetical protein
MLLVMVEAGRVVLLRRAGLAAGIARDRIPFGRWILAPWRTWVLWRRMVLWRVTSYRAALDMELRLREANIALRMRYGRRWRREAPADLVWMLPSGVLGEETRARLDELIGRGASASVSGRAGEDALSAHVGEGDGRITAQAAVEVDEQFEQVVLINKRHWARKGRPVSAETVRKHLQIDSSRARALTRADQ